MKFHQFQPFRPLQSLVECYWIVEGESTAVSKIIPDGYPEMIFHFGDHYEIFSGKDGWERQSLSLAAGQLTQPILLRPSGRSLVFGVKFKPSAMWKLFQCNMHDLQNKTVSLEKVIGINISSLSVSLSDGNSHESMIKRMDDFLQTLTHEIRECPLDAVIDYIHQNTEQISIEELCAKMKITSRTLERYFKEMIGLSAKRYIRLIRFSKVFKLLQQQHFSKAEVSYLTGYFDQSHFNRDFKIFSGESPKSYFNQDHAFANFFMNR
jgi:AraC-like DNA-binding protein